MHLQMALPVTKIASCRRITDTNYCSKNKWYVSKHWQRCSMFLEQIKTALQMDDSGLLQYRST